MGHRICYFLVALCALATACGSSNVDGDTDAGASFDAGADAVIHTDGDAGTDPPPDNIGSPLAINLASVNYYSRQWTFLDQTKHGGSFTYAASPAGFDENGWVVTGDAGLFLNTGLEGHYPGGRYLVLYDGEADFFTRDTIWDSNGDPMANDAVLNEAESTPGRLVLEVTPSNNGLVLSYENINSADPVTNLSIVHEDHEETFAVDTFHPQFIASIRPFRALRFMDMMRTNNSSQGQWADRPLPTDALQGTSAGVALEYLIELANRVHASPWFTIPHLADDDYVERFATLVRDTLDSDLDVYIEYSNEVWNSGFEQYEYARSQGEAAGLGTDRDAADRFYIRRAVAIFDLFEAVFAQTGRAGLLRVIASQNSPYWALRMMDWEDPTTGRLGIEGADYWAVAPYFCGSPPSDPQSVQALLDLCETDISSTLSSAREIGDAARAHSVPLISYEGGQHIRNDSANASAQSIYDLANDDPRMGTLYTTYLDLWRADQGQMFTLFSLISGQSVYGRWGILKQQDDLTYPKYAATVSWISNNSVWW